MKLNIIPIGNSKGIRIPSSVLNQCHIKSKVDMLIEDGKIILVPVSIKTRDGWNIKFKDMSKKNDDNLIINDDIDLDSGDWEW